MQYGYLITAVHDHFQFSRIFLSSHLFLQLLCKKCLLARKGYKTWFFKKTINSKCLPQPHECQQGQKQNTCIGNWQYEQLKKYSCINITRQIKYCLDVSTHYHIIQKFIKKIYINKNIFRLLRYHQVGQLFLNF